MRTNVDLSTVPGWLLIAAMVLLLLEIALDVVALVSLYRRPVATVALGNKWIWVAIIVLVNTIGAILYFAIGRKPAQAVDQVSTGQKKRSSAEITEALYGPGDDTAQQ